MADFVLGLSVLSSRAPFDEKVLYSFRIFDLNEDGKISKQELSSVLESGLKERTMNFHSQQLAQMVEFTFAQADLNGDGHIDLQEYKCLVEKQPAMLKSWTVDFKHIF